MNPHFFPDQERDSKPGLAGVHKLVKSSNSVPDSSRSQIPTNWRFAENSDDFWEDIEKTAKITQRVADTNPLTEIDKSASKIREAIQDYESQDEKFDLELMGLISDDPSYETLDTEHILTEAKARLSVMIEEHTDFTDGQVKMLGSLRAWLEKLGKDQDHFTPDVITEAEKFGLSEVHSLLEDIASKREMQAETLETTHQDIVSELDKKIKDALSKLSVERSQSAAASPSPQKRRANISKQGLLESGYAKSSHRISELENQVLTLKKALIEAGTDGPALESGTEISLKKEIEFETRLKIMEEQMKGLKLDNKFIQQQLSKSKQNEISLEKKTQILERQKNMFESNWKAEQAKSTSLQKNYDERVQAAKAEAQAEAAAQITSSIIKKHQDEMSVLQTKHHIEIQALQDKYDANMKSRLKELTDAYESGDESRIITCINRQHDTEIEEIKKQNEKEINKIRKNHENQMTEIVKNYEQLLDNRTEQLNSLRSRIDSEVKMKTTEIQLNADLKINEAVTEEQSKANEIFGTIQLEQQKKIDQLKMKLVRAERERDIMMQVLDSNQLVSQAMFSLDIDDENKEEEEDKDDALEKSLLALKAREMEEQMSRKYNALMSAQKQIIADEKSWEVEQTKNEAMLDHEAVLSRLRGEVVQYILQAYKSLPEKNEILDDIISQLVNKFAAASGENLEIGKREAVISVKEVDIKMDELKKKLIEVLEENEMWKLTLGPLKSFEGKSEKEILEALQTAIKVQAKKYAELEKEKECVVRQLRQTQRTLDEISNNPDGTVIARKFNNAIHTELPLYFDLSVKVPLCCMCHRPVPYRADEIRHKEVVVDFIRCPHCMVQVELSKKDKVDVEIAQKVNALSECELNDLSEVATGKKEMTIELSDKIRVIVDQSNQLRKNLAAAEAQLNKAEDQLAKKKEVLFDPAPVKTRSCNPITVITPDEEPLQLPQQIKLQTQINAVAELLDQLPGYEDLATIAKQTNPCENEVTNLIKTVASTLNEQEKAGPVKTVDASLKQHVLLLSTQNRTLKGQMQKFVQRWVRAMSSMRDELEDRIKELLQKYASSAVEVENLKSKMEAARDETRRAKEQVLIHEKNIEQMQIKLEQSLCKISELEIEHHNYEEKGIVFAKSNKEAAADMDELTKKVTHLQRKVNTLEKDKEQLRLYAQSLETRQLMRDTEIETKMESVPPFIVFSTVPQVEQASKGFTMTPRVTRKPKQVVSPREVKKRQVQQFPNQHTGTFDNVERYEDGPCGSTIMYITNVLSQSKTPQRGASALGIQHRDTTELPVEVVNLRMKQQKERDEKMEEIKKRVNQLEGELLKKNALYEQEKDKAQEGQVVNFKQGVELKRARRELEKSELLHVSTKKALKSAIEQINSRDIEIAGLRRLLNEINTMAGRIANNVEDKVYEEEPPVPMSGDPEIDKTYRRLITTFKDERILEKMADNKLRSMVRWETRRKNLIQRETSRLMGALEAMCFITQQSTTPNKQPIVVISKTTTRKKYLPATRASTTARSSARPKTQLTPRVPLKL